MRVSRFPSELAALMVLVLGLGVWNAHGESVKASKTSPASMHRGCQ
jgi:hypothetical protein